MFRRRPQLCERALTGGNGGVTPSLMVYVHRSRKERFVRRALLKLIRDERGATAVEYGLIIAAIAGVIILVVSALGQKVYNQFNNVVGNMP
jgi:pilus assembly protein Flp/PilA